MFLGSFNENDLASLRKCKIYTPGVSGPPTNLCIEHITASLYDNSLFLLKKGPTMKKWMLMAKGESEGWKRRWKGERVKAKGDAKVEWPQKDKGWAHGIKEWWQGQMFSQESKTLHKAHQSTGFLWFVYSRIQSKNTGTR